MRTDDEHELKTPASAETPEEGSGASPSVPWQESPITLWVCIAATIGWVAWGYFKMRPYGKVISPNGHLVHYSSWSNAHLAYSDIVMLYQTHDLFNHALPYVHVPIQYPVVMGTYMWLAAWFTGVGSYFLASAIGLAACAIGTLLILRRVTPKYYYLFALSPLLLVYSLLNWDLLGIFFMVAGWYLLRREKYAASGIMFSLGVFAKIFPVFLLFFACLKLWRDGQKQQVKRQLSWFAGTSVIINLPFAIANPKNWAIFFAYNIGRGGSSGLLVKLHLTAVLKSMSSGIPGVLHVAGKTVTLSTVIFRGGEDVITFAVGLVAVIWCTKAVWRRGISPATGAAGAFAVFLMMNKVFSPQYMIWMLIFAIIAEWPVWTAWLLAAGGLIDYYNSFTVLFLASRESGTTRVAFDWYYHKIFPLGSDARYIALIATFVAGIRQRLPHAMQSRSPDQGVNGV